MGNSVCYRIEVRGWDKKSELNSKTITVHETLSRSFHTPKLSIICISYSCGPLVLGIM